MKKRILPLAFALAASPLWSQSFEAGLFLGQNSYRSNLLDDEPDAKTVVSARLGYAVLDSGPCLFQLTAGYQPEFDTPVDLSGSGGPASRYGQRYWSLGVMLNIKTLVAFGVGLEYRSENLSLSGPGPDGSTTYGRPWVRADVGYAFPAPVLKPFIGLEVAAPLTSTTADFSSSPTLDLDTNLKSHAPNFQVGLYGGIRF